MTRHPCAPILAAAALAALLSGCVERTITVTSEPPGAIVWLNDVEIGRTPVQTEFTFYGTYDVRLRLEGHEPLITSRHAKAPVYDLPAIDLLAEAVPATIESKIAWHFELTPLPEAQAGADLPALQDQLIQRARETREQVPAPTGGAAPSAPPAAEPSASDPPAATVPPADAPPAEKPAGAGPA